MSKTNNTLNLPSLENKETDLKVTTVPHNVEHNYHRHKLKVLVTLVKDLNSIRLKNNGLKSTDTNSEKK